MTHYPPIDSLRYIAAMADQHLGYIIDRVSQLKECGAFGDDVGEELHGIVEALRHPIVSELNTHTDEVDCYSKGSPVVSAVVLEGDDIYSHIWHPDPAHPRNRAQKVGPFLCGSGSRRYAIVSGPWVLDAAPETHVGPGE